MNILMLTSEFAPATGGIGTYAREIAAAATSLGAKVTVLAPDYSKGAPAEDDLLPFELQRFHGGLHSMRNLPSKILLARNRLRLDDYDIVHAADWPFFIPLALSRRRTRARLLMTVHGTEINETQTPLKRLAIRTAGVFGPRTEVAANSRYTRDLFHSRFAIAPQRINTIPLGVSEFWFGPRNSRKATRKAYGIEADKIVMVTVARLTRRKGHHMTFAALALLPEHLRKRITWLVIGPNGEADYVEELRDMVKTSDCDVHLLGPLPSEAIRDIYGASDFFCLTGVPESSGRVEGFGLVYLEAGAGGLPSVATAVGGVPDAVIGDETGLLVEPAPEAISHAIAEIVEDSDTRSILAAGASAHARALSWERCAAETYGLPRSGERAILKASDGHSARHQARQGERIPRPLQQANEMKPLIATIALIGLITAPAHAESCSKSRDYLLGSLSGDLPQPPQAYQSLFKMCLATTHMSNVKDAYVLKDGGIAVIPKQDSVAATAGTLSAFCDTNPRGILRFLTRKDLSQTTSIARIVQFSSTGSTPCRKIKGNSLS